MSKKCNKVKNPCKICLGPVTQKTGLQCQGACQCWVHYACLNYTPGKIKDIKAGIIKVTCPCPDCKTSQPKEYRTDTPYSCNNSMCPANRPPKCENHECPINDPKSNPLQATQGTGRPPCPLNKCAKNDCKQHSSPRVVNGTHLPQISIPPCKPDSCDANPLQPKCLSGCSSQNDMSGDFRNYQGRSSISASADGISQTMDVVEKMCNTVGELTNQIQQLMCQMKKAVNESQGPGPGSPSPRPKPVQQSKCPKPCFCPGNPCQRS